MFDLFALALLAAAMLCAVAAIALDAWRLITDQPGARDAWREVWRLLRREF